MTTNDLVTRLRAVGGETRLFHQSASDARALCLEAADHIENALGIIQDLLEMLGGFEQVDDPIARAHAFRGGV